MHNQLERAAVAWSHVCEMTHVARCEAALGARHLDLLVSGTRRRLRLRDRLRRVEVRPRGLNGAAAGRGREELLAEQSTNYAEPSIADYNERRGPLVEYWRAQNDQQSGDPAKLARAHHDCEPGAAAAPLHRRRRCHCHSRSEGAGRDAPGSSRRPSRSTEGPPQVRCKWRYAYAVRRTSWSEDMDQRRTTKGAALGASLRSIRRPLACATDTYRSTHSQGRHHDQEGLQGLGIVAQCREPARYRSSTNLVP
jgi:hypothetical protein